MNGFCPFSLIVSCLFLHYIVILLGDCFYVSSFSIETLDGKEALGRRHRLDGWRLGEGTRLSFLRFYFELSYRLVHLCILLQLRQSN